MSLRASTPEPKDHVTVRLDPEQAKQLRELAALNERTVSAELRIALRRYLAEAKAAA